MGDLAKQEICAILDLLHGSLVRNGVSIATNEKGDLIFFDTAAYVNSGKKTIDGFKVNINNLVE